MEQPILTLLIPCYNEVSRLPRALDELAHWIDLQNDTSVKIVFVDDGSTDGSADLIRQHRLRSELLILTSNFGKGGALAEGMKTISTDLVLTMDLDISTHLGCISEFVRHQRQTGADLIVGSRFHPQSYVHRPFIRSLASYGFFFVIHAIAGFRTFDTQCGFKLFRTQAGKDLFSDLQLKRYSFDLEILWKAEERYHIQELPIHWSDRGGSKLRLFSDGFQMIRDLLTLSRSKG
jgi:dolichyl-phosphate beta-glucosyltransferase